MRAGVIHNPRSHGNRLWPTPPHPDALFADPASPEALTSALTEFAAQSVELLIIDGGDGTVREVLGALPQAFGADIPLLTVIASGKTNVLAFDLGIRGSWTVEAALAAAASPNARVRLRPPINVMRDGTDQPPLKGFVFGTAGLVRARAMAQDLHRSGVFRNAAVALTLAGAMIEFATSAEHGVWRKGEPLSLAIDDAPARTGDRLITMATTLERLPFALRPFGPSHHGLKFLDIDAPPKRLLRTLPQMLWGRDDQRLAALGYRRGDARQLHLSLQGVFVLDGEVYAGGALTLTEGASLRFLTP